MAELHRENEKISQIGGVIMEKTLGELIDELSIVNIKSYMLVDKVRARTATVEDQIKIDDLNIYRSQLKNAINKHFKERQEIKT